MDIYNCRVLLVDDNIELAAMIADILRRHGYSHVVSAISAREGLQVFEKEKPDIVILDVMLQDEDGFSLFKKIWQQAELPILFLSARDQDEDRLFGLGLGDGDYIPKPFLPQELILRVDAVLRRTYQPWGKNDRRGQDAEAWQQKGFL